MKHDKKKITRGTVEKVPFKDFILTPLTKSKLQIICAILIFGFTLSVFYHFLLINYLGYDGYPFLTFLFKPWDSFMDFFNIYKQTASLDPYKEFANYFPLTFIFVYLLTLFPPAVAFFIFSLSFIAFFLFFIYTYLPRMNVFNRILITFIFSFMSYPFLFTLDRGNLEAWVFISIALFLHFYLKGKDALSILFLAIAISLKLYPAILVILFLFNRKYLNVIYSFSAALFLSLVSAGFLQGGVKATLHGIAAGLSAFSGTMTFGPQGLQKNLSLYAPLRLFFDYITIQVDKFSFQNDQLFYNAYYFFALILFGVIAFFLYRYKISLWKRVSILVLSFIVLPQISFDYKLISVFIPLMLFICSDEVSKYNTQYSIIFGLLLIPKDYYFIVDEVGIAIIFNPLLIMLMICLICIESVPANKKTMRENLVKIPSQNLKVNRDRRKNKKIQNSKFIRDT